MIPQSIINKMMKEKEQSDSKSVDIKKARLNLLKLMEVK